tara:strand:+ start:2014 stop:2958 length:945 start_codon:yes stop_codon:yes gene_type:complete
MINYNFLDRALHHLILSTKFAKKSLYEIEKILFLKKQNIKNNKHIFITGLPRSGSTALLNFFNNNNELCSLKYKDMPFIMAPNIAKFFKKKRIVKSQRFHNDNIFFDLDSPESFDEAFFSAFNEKDINEELITYVSLILSSYNKNRYLSKNNNNYKRINLIKNIFPDSIFLLPVREPLQHANSLFLQHLNFLNLQKKDRFIIKYMNYLGHNEFGINHKHWFKPKKYKNLNNLNYWLEQWYYFYKFLLNSFQNKKFCKFLVYENMKKGGYLSSMGLGEELTLKNQNFFKISKKKIEYKFDKELYNQTLNIYNKFL